MLDVIHTGGPVMVPLIAAALMLYYLGFREWLALGEAIRNRTAESGFPGGVNRRLRLLAVLVAVCPLLGLLGTVMGMQGTFAALGGGDPGPGVSRGVASALLSTQTGLLFAIPGNIRLFAARSRRNHLLIHLSASHTRSAVSP